MFSVEYGSPGKLSMFSSAQLAMRPPNPRARRSQYTFGVMFACSGMSVVYSLCAITTSRAPFVASAWRMSARFVSICRITQADSNIAKSETFEEPRMGKPSRSMCFW